MKSGEIHKDCSRKCESLSSELQLAKARLEKLKISCGRTFCNPDGMQGLSCSKLPTSPKLGKCDCPNKSGPPSTDMYVTEMMNQYNGAQRHDPQMLMDHIKEEHPHLIKRVLPKLPLSALKIGSNYQEDNDQEANVGTYIGKVGCGLESSCGSGSKSPISIKSPQQSYNGKRKMVHKSTSSCKKQKGPTYKATSNIKQTITDRANLSPTQRYNFYRYFGYAGQGAKTSKDWYSVKTTWVPVLVSP